MPPICTHLSIAWEVARKLHHPVIEQNLGGYLVGSTLADVHILGQISRAETHFFDLEGESPESGARAIFEAYPQLGRREGLDSALRSLVAGYLSHLVTDEVWILDIYRPLFGSSSPLSEEPMANVLDRAVQYELDRREREDREMMEEIRSQIYRWEPGLGLEIIDDATLSWWRDFVCAATAREPTMALFPLFAHRYLLPRYNLDPQQLERFLAALPAKLEWALDYITWERIAAFRQKSIAESMAAAREYLGEDN